MQEKILKTAGNNIIHWEFLALDPDLGAVIKNAMLIKHGLQLSLHRQVLGIGVEFNMDFIYFVICSAVSGEMIRIRQKITDKRWVWGFAFCKVVIGKRDTGCL
jgi:hypothetical protein